MTPFPQEYSRFFGDTNSCALAVLAPPAHSIAESGIRRQIGRRNLSPAAGKWLTFGNESSTVKYRFTQ
jgi:hypothetical protein